jgi:hypothetical protein
MSIRKIIFIPLWHIFSVLSWGLLLPGCVLMDFADWLHDRQFEPTKREG